MAKRVAWVSWLILLTGACGGSETTRHDGAAIADQVPADQLHADAPSVEPDAGADGLAGDGTSDTGGPDARVDVRASGDAAADGRSGDAGHDAARTDTSDGATTLDSATEAVPDGPAGLWEVERNNTFDVANDLSAHGFPVEVNATDDVLDFFRINAPAGTLLRVTLTPSNPQSTALYKLRVAHVSGLSPYEHAAEASAAGQRVSREAFVVEGGDYFVQVTGNGTNGHYRLRIEQVALPTPTDVSALTSTTAAFSDGSVSFLAIQPSVDSHAAISATSTAISPRLLVWDPVAQRVIMTARNFAQYGTRVVWEHLASNAFWLVADAEVLAGDGDVSLAIQQASSITAGISPHVSAPLTVGRTVTSIGKLDLGRSAYYRVWLERGNYEIEVNGTLDPVNLMRPQIDVYRADYQTWLRQAARVGYVASTILRVEEPQPVSIRLLDDQPFFPLKTSYTLKITPSSFSPPVPTVASSSPVLGQLGSANESVIYAFDHPGGVFAVSVDGDGTFIPAIAIWEDNPYSPGTLYNMPYNAVTNRFAMWLLGPRRYYLEVNARYSRSSGNFTLRWEHYDIPPFGAAYLRESETPATLGANDSCAAAEHLSVIPGAIEANLEQSGAPDADAFTFTATATSHQLRTFDTYSTLQDVQMALYDPAAPSTPLATSEDINLSKEVWQTEINATGLTVGKTYCVVVSRDPTPEIVSNTWYLLLVNE